MNDCISKLHDHPSDRLAAIFSILYAATYGLIHASENKSTYSGKIEDGVSYCLEIMETELERCMPYINDEQV